MRERANGRINRCINQRKERASECVNGRADIPVRTFRPPAPGPPRRSSGAACSSEPLLPPRSGGGQRGLGGQVLPKCDTRALEAYRAQNSVIKVTTC